MANALDKLGPDLPLEILSYLSPGDLAQFQVTNRDNKAFVAEIPAYVQVYLREEIQRIGKLLKIPTAVLANECDDLFCAVVYLAKQRPPLLAICRDIHRRLQERIAGVFLDTVCETQVCNFRAILEGDFPWLRVSIRQAMQTHGWLKRDPSVRGYRTTALALVRMARFEEALVVFCNMYQSSQGHWRDIHRLRNAMRSLPENADTAPLFEHIVTALLGTDEPAGAIARRILQGRLHRSHVHDQILRAFANRNRFDEAAAVVSTIANREIRDSAEDYISYPMMRTFGSTATGTTSSLLAGNGYLSAAIQVELPYRGEYFTEVRLLTALFYYGAHLKKNLASPSCTIL